MAVVSFQRTLELFAAMGAVHVARGYFLEDADLKVTFDLNGEPVEVPCTVGVKKGCPLSPTLFLFVIQACLESLEKAMPADVKLKYRTNTKTEGKNGGHVSMPRN